MRKSKFTDSQIMDAGKRVEAGLAVPDICRELGVSTATSYKWRTKCGGMDVSMISRMKELEEENWCLKKMNLEEKLKAEIVAEALEKSGEVITQTGDGQKSSERARCVHTGGMPGVWHQRVVLSLRAHARRGERRAG
jgi:putative transposase